MNYSSMVLKRILVGTVLLALAVAVIGGIVGGVIAGGAGVASALIGSGMALIFSGMTILSVKIASQRDPLFFFPIVMGAWLVKAVIFLVIVFVLRNQEFVNGPVLFWSLVAVIFGSLVIDVAVALRTRSAYASNVLLPGDEGYKGAGQ